MANYPYTVNFPGPAAYPPNNQRTAYPQTMPNAYQIQPNTLPFDDSVISIGARPQVNLPFRASVQGQHPQTQPNTLPFDDSIISIGGRPRVGLPFRPLFQGQHPQSRPKLRPRILPEGVAVQARYLDTLASREISNAEISTEELAEKDALRLSLEKICRKTVADYGQDAAFVADSVELKCFGSLSTTFATKSSDMDLMLLSPMSKPETSSPESRIPRSIEKALLELGYGARLLTKTRVPIIKFYEKPPPEFMAYMLMERQKYENERDDTRQPGTTEGERTHSPRCERGDTGQHGITEGKRIHLPQREGPPDSADMGIQCDINFSNQLALHNSHLLKCYSLCDPRVRRMVLFVKSWSKKRKINSPYHGTLSSYGYVLMVLHYLVNIASPSVLPNLQLMPQAYSDELSAREVELNDCDIRFFRNKAAIEDLQRRKSITCNAESLGSLLRDFFHYYAQQEITAPKGGFRWTLDALSLRTGGGILPKEHKGWTVAKTETTETTGHDGQKNTKTVRQRYLFAIEDPFEWKHNVARTVVHNGVVAIRDEFRRAHRLINFGDKRVVSGPGYLFSEAEAKSHLQQHRAWVDKGKEERVNRGKISSRAESERLHNRDNLANTPWPISVWKLEAADHAAKQ